MSGGSGSWEPSSLWRGHSSAGPPLPGLDLLPLCVTFLLCFWEVQYGILAGTLVSMLVLLHSVARPKIQVAHLVSLRGTCWPQGARWGEACHGQTL